MTKPHKLPKKECLKSYGGHVADLKIHKGLIIKCFFCGKKLEELELLK